MLLKNEQGKDKEKVNSPNAMRSPKRSVLLIPQTINLGELTSSISSNIPSTSTSNSTSKSTSSTNTTTEKYNNYDTNRAENTCFTMNYHCKTKRNYNKLLFQNILNEYQKNVSVRPTDLIKGKVCNCVSSISTASKKGKHVTYGENVSVNQDVGFIYRNFMLIQNVYLFGICDGHGSSGHYISSYAKEYIPTHFHYIEIDNNVTKRNKSINNLITSLYSISESSNVKEMNIIKYFYDKFGINYNDLSIVRNNFKEICELFKETFYRSQEGLKEKEYDSNLSGSTVCISLISGKNLYCVNIGDSRAILCGVNNGEWKASQLMKEHKPNDKDELSRIIKAGGKIHKERDIESLKENGPIRVWFEDESQGPGLAMSRSYGDIASKSIGVSGEPDIYQYTLCSNDKFIVVASDGVWEYLTNEMVMDIVRKAKEDGKNASESCDVLIQAASAKWKERRSKSMDDITCVIVYISI